MHTAYRLAMIPTPFETTLRERRDPGTESIDGDAAFSGTDSGAPAMVQSRP